MPSEGTTRRSIRIDDELWSAALAAVAENGDNLSDIMREALRAYVEAHKKTPPILTDDGEQ